MTSTYIMILILVGVEPQFSPLPTLEAFGWQMCVIGMYKPTSGYAPSI